MIPFPYFKPIAHARQDCAYQLFRATRLAATINAQYDEADGNGADLSAIYLILNRLHITEAERDALAEQLNGLKWYSEHLNRLLKFLVPATAWEFNQGDFINGHCLAYAAEFAAQRLAGRSISVSLAAMRSPKARHRLIQTQRASENQFNRTFLRAPPWLPQKAWGAKFTESITTHMQDLRYAGGIPSWADAKLANAGSVRSDLGCGHVMQLWPRTVPRDEADFTAAARRNWCKPRRRLPGGPDSGLAGDPALMDTAGTQQWSSSLQDMLGPILRRSRHGGLFIIDVSGEVHAHVLVLDLSSRDPGLMDPNFGYIPLPSRSERDPALHWLLAVIACIYETSQMQFCFFEFSPFRPRLPLPGPRMEEPDFVRWHG